MRSDVAIDDQNASSPSYSSRAQALDARDCALGAAEEGLRMRGAESNKGLRDSMPHKPQGRSMARSYDATQKHSARYFLCTSQTGTCPNSCLSESPRSSPPVTPACGAWWNKFPNVTEVTCGETPPSTEGPDSSRKVCDTAGASKIGRKLKERTRGGMARRRRRCISSTKACQGDAPT